MTMTSASGTTNEESMQRAAGTRVLTRWNSDALPIDFPDPHALEKIVSATTVPAGYQTLNTVENST
jgi:hypothetical protein